MSAPDDSSRFAARWRRRLDSWVGGLCAALLALMVVNVSWQVFSRYVLRDPSSVTEELARFLLIWLGLFGGAYALGRGQHVAIDALVVRLPAGWRRGTSIAASLCVLTFAISLLLFGGTRLALLVHRLDQESAALGVGLAWVYAALPLSGLVFAGFALLDLADAVRPREARE
ncbi:MAG: TRAP transporter small permease [Acidobacteria bacterium]|nr:MAG: TRAP transporter small permease [Acidobacteriota bacterium]REK03871.1 MAG: TRAP transporter small permease [Acidobacteriota bacterium]